MNRIKKNPRFSRQVLNLIKEAIKIIELYKSVNASPTTLKIFNRMVRDGTIAETKNEYKRLSEAICKARTSGLIGWNDIEGRNQKREGDVEL